MARIVMPCQVCGGIELVQLIDAGEHPVSNRFLQSRDAFEERFPLALGQCTACGLIQLTRRMAPETLVSPYEWVTYNEPEGHLDVLAETLMTLRGVGPRSVIGAITYKDESTLRRLRERGIENSWSFNTKDLAGPPGAGVETLQGQLTPQAVEEWKDKYPPVDVLLVRHILEHTYDPKQFVAALRTWVRPGGYMVFEVPDCAQVIASRDYSRLWEEHILYFTPTTFRNSLRRMGLEIDKYECFEYASENSLVAFVRDTECGVQSHYEDVSEDRERAARFGAAFAGHRLRVHADLRSHHARGGRIAVFGAGHLAAMFINLMGVADLIEFVIDDHPAKQGLFMPGSRLPIRSSEELMRGSIDLCLSSLSPESEVSVLERLHTYISNGGQFLSIFPSSPRAMRAVLDGPRPGSGQLRA